MVLIVTGDICLPRYQDRGHSFCSLITDIPEHPFWSPIIEYSLMRSLLIKHLCGHLGFLSSAELREPEGEAPLLEGEGHMPATVPTGGLTWKSRL